ncbi:hypothetical protein ACE14D_00425 [Streptomyces sp. Act-28]
MRGRQDWEPESLVAVKGEIERRRGAIDLLDVLKHAGFDTDFVAEFTSVATRENLSGKCCGAGCCRCCSPWAPTWASSGSR